MSVEDCIPQAASCSFLPITYHNWSQGGGNYGDITLHGAEFTEDFGPWKKGEMPYLLIFSFATGRISSYDDMGRYETVKYKVIPLDGSATS